MELAHAVVGGTARAENFVILRELVAKEKGDWGLMTLRKFALGFVVAGAVACVSVAQIPAEASGASASAPVPAAKRGLAVEDYFRLKEVSDPQVSADAKWVAYVVKTAE